MKIIGGLKSVGSLWVVQVLKLVLSILVSILVIRYLGPEQYGVLGIASACAVLFSALVGLPQGGLVVRELAKVGEPGAVQVLSTAFGLRFAGSVLQLILTVAAVALIGYGHDVRWASTFIAVAYVASSVSVLSSGLEFDGRFDRVAAIELAAAIATSLGRLVLVAIAAPLLWFAAAGIFDALVVAGLYCLGSPRRSQIRPFGGFSPALARSFLWDGWPIALSGMIMAVYTRADVIVISRLLGEREAGYYTAAMRMTEVLYYFPAVIASIYLPTLARRRQDDSDGYYRLITNSCGAAFWLGMLLAIGLTIAAPLLLPILLGAKFSASIGVVQISAWSVAVIALTTAFGSSLTIEHATRVPLYTTLLAALVNLALLYVLVPWLGINGAALATLAAQATSLAATFLFYRDARLFSAVLAAMSPAFVVTMWQTAWQMAASGRR